MQGKTIRESRVILSHLMLPEDTNPAGNVHGGVIMKYIDNAAGVVAVRHARKLCVTASVDRLDFYNPVFIGNLLIIKASLNLVGRTSAEIGVRVEAEDVLTGKIRHVVSAYLTFVALDDQMKPASMPPLVLENEDEKRRNREAMERRKVRLAEKQKEKACQENQELCP
ncbi:acyl-CoA thioesterase [Desulfobotulus sp. H1]|uniref:Acyl-CoA thioesterase n=1 Tax=Desulfobotulus pelophilus TaxID=2823377 RepID=A0ABT3N5V5_9BACT|nr:acyl-CoA thioesterase [Desulfobotulus pelophilus]MCW7752846.1 acyl-CoA thioesterase [Desulfobotulus pelophilus]